MTQNKGELVLDGQKLAWHRDRVEAWLRGEKIAPITIDCALTRACNYRCTYCYGQLQENLRTRLSRDNILLFMDDAAEIGVKAVSLVSDGESTCSPHLSEAIVHGRHNGLDMALGTNGALLDPEIIHTILPALTYIRVNMSAGEPERYRTVHGCRPGDFDRVCANIREAVSTKRRGGLQTTIGLQMVLIPELEDQIIPLARLGQDLGVDYLVIKHCSDDERGTLGVDYQSYHTLVEKLKVAEGYSTPDYLVKAKWSKILSDGQRGYSQCYGPAFIMQFSGSGLVAPCGMLFNTRYSKYHIGNIAETRFKEIWQSKRYDDVLNLIASDYFDAKTMCGTLCLQHKVNEYLWAIKHGRAKLEEPKGEPPQHINFI